MRVDGERDYKVTRDYYGDINAIRCAYCSFVAARPDFMNGSDRSGHPRYNRMRGAMVKHLHKNHRDKLADAEGGN